MTGTKRVEPNRVWIELEYPADSKEGDIRAARASALLSRLGHYYENTFWWNSRISKYCVTIDSGGGFLECNDNGHWFNLDHLGREPRPKKRKAA
jgi:hypothetical protein